MLGNESGAIRLRTILLVANLVLGVLMLSPGFRREMWTVASPLMEEAVDKALEIAIGQAIAAAGDIPGLEALPLDGDDLAAILSGQQSVDPAMAATALAVAARMQAENPGDSSEAATIVARAQQVDPSAAATALAEADAILNPPIEASDAGTGEAESGETGDSTNGSGLRNWLESQVGIDTLIPKSSTVVKQSTVESASDSSAPAPPSGPTAPPNQVDLALLIAQEVAKELPQGMAPAMVTKVSTESAEKILQEIAGRLPPEISSLIGSGKPIFLSPEEAKRLAASIPSTTVSPVTGRVLQRIAASTSLASAPIGGAALPEAPTPATKPQESDGASASVPSPTPAASEPSPTPKPRLSPTPTQQPDAVPIDPILVSLESNGDGEYTATFAYHSPNDFVIGIPVGPDNRFDPLPIYRGQPSTFQPGDSSSRLGGTFEVVFDGGELIWHLDGDSVSAIVYG